jgi:uncharacterized protein (DUF2235 family)
MAKNIIFCADGTWVSSADQTNVYCVYKALLKTPAQITQYDGGVGSDGASIEKLLDGAPAASYLACFAMEP